MESPSPPGYTATLPTASLRGNELSEIKLVQGMRICYSGVLAFVSEDSWDRNEGSAATSRLIRPCLSNLVCNLIEKGAMEMGVAIVGIVYLAIIVFLIASVWKVFTKGGQPGWAALIPIYNMYVLLKVAGKPGWWLILFFIPIVSIVFGILALAGLAANFGKGVGFVIGLIFLPFIFFPILGFGAAKYSPVVTAQA